MSDLYHDRVDIYQIDDEATDDRMARSPSITLVTPDVLCRIHATAVHQTMAGGREVTIHHYDVLIPGVYRLNTSHRLNWTTAPDETTRTLNVTGSKDRKSQHMPTVVKAEWIETAETP